MSKLPIPASGLRAHARSAVVLVSVLTVTVLGVLAAWSPPGSLTFGMVAIGAPLAAIAAVPDAVLLVGLYAFVVAFGVSTAQGLLGSGAQTARLALVGAATAIGWALARYQQRLHRINAGASREREMLAAVAAQSVDAIIASTLDGTLIAWNSGAERMYGWTAAEVVGRHFGDILPSGRSDELRDTLLELAAGNRIRIDESRRIRKDGSGFLVSVDVWPIRDDAGLVVAAAATERDITEEKIARERAARADRLESLGQLAGGVAHDFNNLLAIILNYADFLDDQVTGEAADDLSRIRSAADRARSLTGQLLLFAKREPTEVAVIDLNRVVTEADDLLSRTIGENVRLVCRTAAGAVPVRANRGRLDQILLNLVINARDAMPDGGVVVVETDCLDLPDVPEAPSPPGRYARLTVSDTGCGMTPEVRDRLFEPFFTTKPPDRGTGLGLATVYGIVGDAGGTIAVESEPGIGTTFRILLPSAVVTGAEADRSAGELAHGHGELVMVVEDDDYVRDLVIRILRDNGYRATAFAEEPPDGPDLHDVALVVTDVVLRGHSGPALATRLRARRPDLRVLFMSGYSDAEVRREHGIGPEIPIVQKPFTAVELLAVVGDAISAVHANEA